MKRLAIAISVLGLVGAAGALVPAGAAGSSLTVPAKGPAKTSTSWSGTVPLGLDPTAQSCSQGSKLSVEKHTFTVAVPKGAYNIVNASLALTVESNPFLNGDFIELLDPSGQNVGADQQKAQMEVDVPNPEPGTWTAEVCQFLPDDHTDGHPYTAQVTITTTCKGHSPCPAPVKKAKKKR